MSEKKITVIVPVLKNENHLNDCLNSLVNQTMDQKEMEIVLFCGKNVENQTVECGQEFAKKYSNIEVKIQSEESLEELYKQCIKGASGKYIMPIFADGELAQDAVEKAAAFLEENRDAVDILVYPKEISDETVEMTESRVYPLVNPEDVSIIQDGLCVCVKKACASECLGYIDAADLANLKYYGKILDAKAAIGFCKEIKYQASYHDKSMDEIHNAAFYTFESNMEFWEKLFSQYKELPYYIQALYLCELNQKVGLDLIFPYHYAPQQLEEAKNRVYALLNRVEDPVILSHTKVDNFHKHYFISMKTDNEIEVSVLPDEIIVYNHKKEILKETNFQMVLSQFKPENNRIRFLAYLKSAAFNYLNMPTLYMIKNKNMENPEKAAVCLSACSYYKGKSLTNSFWQIVLDIDMADLDSFEFRVGIDDTLYPCRYYFTERVCFNRSYKRYRYIKDNVEYRFRDNVFYVRKVDILRKAKFNLKKDKSVYGDKRNQELAKYCMTKSLFEKDVWLYCDSRDVKWDNAYYQFIHDVEKKDGIKRYYVINKDNFEEARNEFPEEYRKRMIEFGSDFHKRLYLKAKKVLIAFAGVNTYMPFEVSEYQKFMDVSSQPEIIYLQHGVLHAHMPWKYSYGRLRIDKEVVSTRFEKENLMKNYCFTEEALIEAGMPRYDFIDLKQDSVNRILFAPSWRKYLIDRADGEWVPTEEAFLQSKFYKETIAFLNSKKLEALLEKYDFYLDFKPHPIFEVYKHLYNIENSRVTLAESKVSETQYKIFMTDFSSFVFDFVYLERAIIYFMPDDEMFRAGMSGYRELDMPLNDAFGEFVTTAEAAVDAVCRIIENGCKAEQKYADKMKEFFLYKDDNQRERIYQVLYQK